MRSTLLGIAILTFPMIAWAGPDDEDAIDATIPVQDHADATSIRVPIMWTENMILTVPPVIYYWLTPNSQKQDWALNWDWPSWKRKLTTFDALVLDTNNFETNAVRHPLVGALTYQIGRANGLGPGASTLLTFAVAVIWEYVIEFKEEPSSNDIVENTAAGFLLGEPLFQVGLLADTHPSVARRTLAMLVSPFHRAQKELGMSPLVDQVPEPSRLEAFAGTHLTRQTGEGTRESEVRVGLDLETFRDRDFARPGDDARLTGAGTWNRVAVDLRMGGLSDKGFSGGELRSSTTYVGRLGRSVDEFGLGRQTFLGLGAGFDLVERRLPTDWDKYSVFQLVEPRAGAWWRTPVGELDVEAGVSADVAMVEAHALAFEPRIPNSSVVLSRGYYYATGASAQARARVRRGRWNADVEAIAHQFWSYDAHAHGGKMDPRNLVDRRVTARALLGVKPFAASDLQVELYGEHVNRRGTGEDMVRETTELDTGLAVRAEF